MNLIDKRGAFYNYDNTRLGQGRENAKEFLENSPAIAARIETAIREKSVMAPAEGMVVAPDDAEDEG